MKILIHRITVVALLISVNITIFKKSFRIMIITRE